MTEKTTHTEHLISALGTDVQLRADEYDTLSIQVASAWRSGMIDEAEARRSIAELVFRSRVVTKTATSTVFGARSALLTHEVADRANDYIYDAIVFGDATVLDLNRLIDERVSTIGWARKRTYNFSRSKAHDLREVSRRHEPIETDMVALSLSETVNPQAATNAALHSDLDAAIESARYKSRDPLVRLAQSQTLRAMTGVPKALAPRSRQEKYELRMILALDPGAAMRALTGRHDPTTTTVDPRVAALWDDYGPEEVQLVLETAAATTDPETTVALLAYEVLHTPNRPVAKIVTRLIRSAGALSRMTGWAGSCQRLIEAYLAVTRTAVSCGDNRSSDERKAALTIERDELARQWPTILADHLAAFPASPLGADEDQVAFTIDLLLADLEDAA